MTVLVLKIIVTPLLIGGASLASRRWGPMVAGWLVALPLTSGPVAFFLALDHGTAFAASAVEASLAGLAAIVFFSLVYARVAPRHGPARALAAASIAYVVVAVILQPVVAAVVPVWTVLALVLVVITAALRILPVAAAGPSAAAHPRWDLPARMVVGTGLVVGLTSVAPWLGPHWSGLVATFPVYVSVMTVFAQRHDGAGAAVGLLRGLMVGLFGTAGFYTIVNLSLSPLGVGPAFGLGVSVALAVQAVTLRSIRASGGIPTDASV